MQQFVSVFEETEDVSNHKWLVSVHRSNDIILPEKMTGDAVLKTFRIKALDQYYSLSKVCGFIVTALVPTVFGLGYFCSFRRVAISYTMYIAK